MDSKLTIDEYGNKRWRNSLGEFHRENGPAIEWSNGTKEWYIRGKLHREDGPAVEWGNGTKEWWIHGVQQKPPENLLSYQSDYEKVITDGF